MAQNPAVHIEPGDGRWTVVREGNKRATSTHATQSEAAESGRDLAKRDSTEFFLHGQDGQIREHRDYSEVEDAAGEGIVDTTLGTVGTVTDAADGITGAAAQAFGPDTAQRDPAGEAAAGTGRARSDRYAAAGGPGRQTGAVDETHGLADAGLAESTSTPEERYADYGIYDQVGERIGPLNDLFVDDNDEMEYLGVGIGSPTDRSVLVPAEVITVNDGLRRMVVSRPKGVVESGPGLGYAEEVTRELERRVRLHYELEAKRDTEDRADLDTRVPELPEVGSLDPSPGLPDDEEDEVRVRRSEEEIQVEKREREAGTMRIRKRVRTDRERIEVPKKRVEVTVERVPVEEGSDLTGERSTAVPEIGEEEIVVPIVEEVIVIEKRAVVKEEIRIRKQVVEEVEVIEEDVRKEEIEIEDDSGRDTGL